MEEFIIWLKEYISNKGFQLFEYEDDIFWYNSGYSTIIEVDNNDNLIIGRPIDDIYSVFKIDDKIDKNEITDEISFYMQYYINKNWKY